MDFKKYFERQNYKLTDKETISIKIGGLITAARLHACFSQKELAEKIGTQQPSVARAERGEVIASIEFLYKIAKAINTEFIFPKFGFMLDREKSSNLQVTVTMENSNVIVTPTGQFLRRIHPFSETKRDFSHSVKAISSTLTY